EIVERRQHRLCRFLYPDSQSVIALALHALSVILKICSHALIKFFSLGSLRFGFLERGFHEFAVAAGGSRGGFSRRIRCRAGRRVFAGVHGPEESLGRVHPGAAVIPFGLSLSLRRGSR